MPSIALFPLKAWLWEKLLKSTASLLAHALITACLFLSPAASLHKAFRDIKPLWESHVLADVCIRDGQVIYKQEI